jgi:Skp family chaperone for outer membrane proteins
MKMFSLAVFAVGMLAPVVDRAVQPRAVPPIAYVSVQRISAESIEGKAAVKRLEALGLARAQELRAKQQTLETTRTELANAGGVFQASRRAELKTREEQQRADFQKSTQQAQVEVQELQRQLQNKLRQELTAILSDMAKRKSIQIVLNQDTAVVWAPEGSDVTAEVVERLNSLPQAAPDAK